MSEKMDIDIDLNFSSGIPALDGILQGILPGDNIIFQIDKIENYFPFVHAFCSYVNKEKLDLIYFRYADHPFLIPNNIKASIYELNPEKGFDYFLSEIIRIIEKHGVGACYVFDSLSDLAVDWYSNAMLGNFFMLVCPYLFELKTVAFFALFRHFHDSKTLKDIHDTAQVIIDVYNDEDNYLYVHPLKVFQRYSSNIYMLHKWIDLGNPESPFLTIKESAEISDIISEKYFQWLDPEQYQIDAWHLSFQEAQKTLEELICGEGSNKDSGVFKSKLLRKAIVQDELQLMLALKYFDIEDILAIRKRMIGTGFIGGKSLGLLLSRAILKQETPTLAKKLEKPDSFYIGTDVFYTYLVKNNCWWMRKKISTPETFLEGWKETEEKILKGKFPEYFVEKFNEILDYYGQAPIVVRSSYSQEDSIGNVFSGKYDSVFCVNQKNPEERLAEFIKAIKKVYASTINPEAMIYRKKRGLLEEDEQMAILVQRVSGSIHGKYFFPQVAGSGFSFNPYVWNEKIDPYVGFLRLVFGLGTRAVQRKDDDFTRIVALSNPLLRVEKSPEEIREFSQKKVDLLDIEQNQLIMKNFLDLKSIEDDLPLKIFATYDYELENLMRRLNRPNIFPWVLTFDYLLEKTEFTNDMKEILKQLEKAYGCAVDIEFTVNFSNEEDYRINLLQCRRFQIKNEIKDIPAPKDINPENIIIKTSGPILGTSLASQIDRIVYVVPKNFSKLNQSERYSIARLIGKINQLDETNKRKFMLLGPGRWGSTMPSFGVPVVFSEINNFSIICEIAEKIGELIPDISLGTHFFNDLVESDMLYLVVDPEKENYILNKEFFENAKNSLSELVPDSEPWIDFVKVIDLEDKKSSDIYIYMNAFTQKGICYFKKDPSNQKK